MISVIFKNSEILVVNKPSGISVHNKEDPNNLLDLLIQQESLSQLFPAHRLDKETSGIQILALSQEAASFYAQQFQSNSVQKYYQGILRGSFKGINPWNQSLTDKSEGRTHPAGLAKSRIPCLTEYKIIKKNNYFTFCEFDLKTGRQHQIRKHAALANHAIVGDPRYGDAKYNTKIFGLYQVHRMFLHCHKVGIKNHTFECPMDASFEKLVSQIV